MSTNKWRIPGFISWASALKKGNFAAIADWFILYFLLFGGTGLFSAALAAYFDHDSKITGFAFAFRIFAFGLFLAAAFGVSGWLLGLLFGIPRTLARAQAPMSPPAAPSATGSMTAQTSSAPGASNSSSRVNTNLEDISDWLTKTIVGVGLTQLNNAAPVIWRFTDELNKTGFHWMPQGQTLAFALLFYFLPGGFWLGYVGTRTILTKLFDSIEINPSAVLLAADPLSLKLNAEGNGVQPATDGLADADRSILQIPLESLATAQEIEAWAAAQARAGNIDVARAIFEELLRRDPGNQTVKQQLAMLAWAANDRARASYLVKDIPDAPIAILDALYQAPPEGYGRAIALGERLLKSAAQQANPNIHLWLACAYGQQFGYESNVNHADDNILDAIKKKLVQEIKTTIALDPTARPVLLALWKPLPGSTEDDLAAIPATDPDIKALLESS